MNTAVKRMLYCGCAGAGFILLFAYDPMSLVALAFAGVLAL